MISNDSFLLELVSMLQRDKERVKPLSLSFGSSSAFSSFSLVESGPMSGPEDCFGCSDWSSSLSGSLVADAMAQPFWGALFWFFGVAWSLPFWLPRPPDLTFPFPPLTFLFLLEKVKGQRSCRHETVYGLLSVWLPNDPFFTVFCKLHHASKLCNNRYFSLF